jgi:hypothetical protein
MSAVRRTLLSALFVLPLTAPALLAGACAGKIPPAQDIASLSKSLGAAGFTVQPPAPAGLLDAGLFEARSVVLMASREKVLAYEFPDEESAQAAAAKVSPDGFGVGSKYVNWATPPSFYRRGKLIAIYEGKTKLVNDALKEAMGPKFAGAS